MYTRCGTSWTKTQWYFSSFILCNVCVGKIYFGWNLLIWSLHLNVFVILLYICMKYTRRMASVSCSEFYSRPTLVQCKCSSFRIRYTYIYTFEAIFEEPYTSLALLLRRYRIIVVCVCARPIPSPYLCSSSRKQIDTLIKANVCTVSVSSKLRTVLPYPYSIVHCRRIGLRDAKQHPKPYKIFLNLKHRQ